MKFNITSVLLFIVGVLLVTPADFITVIGVWMVLLSGIYFKKG